VNACMNVRVRARQLTADFKAQRVGVDLALA
jgi:hypothetical protein